MANVVIPLEPEVAEYLSSSFPQFVKNNGTNFPVSGLAYDAAAEEKAYWKFRAANYASGNLTLDIEWYADTDTTSGHQITWGCRIAAITPDTDTQDVETKAFATQQTVIDSHLGTTGQRLHRCSITISNLDSLAAEDIVWIEISRVVQASQLTGDGILTHAFLSYLST